ncbi:UNVERIFIED_ORG: hypothetical protein M2438_005194 [Methylobacterium sp. SuP10 SLI 274]|uniref:aldehyde dehydrogenase family protein n=1 Tax=Methylorubrum extorquens TaxID=408 RepID=UPI00209EC304|nr:aldehyde dehydrogenase family protein [Methylorubrum extorquens]MDF9866439.1 hypothetical protein [Methylorubrum pseudosasae]MDH6639948.1 hypothetical protein [Methylobacterium sp. SuP10 SLI 274]MDH6669316.1 hypothetical protein [Methylorubrum zatmanii]MCP1561919.1 hypothetical protein [Methylorubrum extorquens]MDF9794736.1 hypothetical protein [Methylorubrum extorquens]
MTNDDSGRLEITESDMTSFGIPSYIDGREVYSEYYNIITDYRGNEITKVNLVGAITALDCIKGGQAIGAYQIEKMSVSSILDIISNAANIFENETINGLRPKDYIDLVSLTSGLPISFINESAFVALTGLMRRMDQIISLQSPSGELEVFDKNFFIRNNKQIGYVKESPGYTAILPGNPGVNGHWLMALGGKNSVTVKPSTREPFTSIRLAIALSWAGLPNSVVNVLHCENNITDLIVQRSKKCITTGSIEYTKIAKNNRNLKVFGPGKSKMIVGSSKCHDLENIAQIIVNASLKNCGSSCLSLSGVLLQKNSEQIAEMVAARFADYPICHPNTKQGRLPVFHSKDEADEINELINNLLDHEAVDLIERRYDTRTRLLNVEGCNFIRPTVIYCSSYKHRLFSYELPFPFVTIAPAPPEEEMEAAIEDTLALWLVGQKDEFSSIKIPASVEKIIACPNGNTTDELWDPHYGYINDWLYKLRCDRNEPESA